MHTERIIFTSRLSSIGDTIIAAQSIATLIKNAYHPVFITNKANFAVAKLIPGLTSLILIENQNLEYYLQKEGALQQHSLLQFQDYLASLNAQKAPVILDLQKTGRSKRALRLVKEALKPNIEKTYCVSKRTLFRIFLIILSYFSYTQKVKRKNFKLLRIHDLQRDTIRRIVAADKKEFLTLDPHAALFSPQKTREIKNSIVLFPGASHFTKMWPKEHYKKLISLLLEKTEFHIILCGSTQEIPVGEYLSFPEEERVQNLIAKLELSETLDVIASAAYVVTGDSFAAHAADAYKIPALVLFGATSPLFGFVPESAHIQVLYQHLSCSPCTRHGTEKCRYGNHLCLVSLTPEMVYHALPGQFKKNQ